jgi:Na+/melibiose symporter-like transporter
VFATIGFCLKAGLALGSASFLWIMEWAFDYDTKLPDAAHAISGYRVTSSIVVGLMFAVCTVLLTAYRLNQRATIEMSDELARRRAAAAAPC